MTELFHEPVMRDGRYVGDWRPSGILKIVNGRLMSLWYLQPDYPIKLSRAEQEWRDVPVEDAYDAR